MTRITLAGLVLCVVAGCQSADPTAPGELSSRITVRNVDPITVTAVDITDCEPSGRWQPPLLEDPLIAGPDRSWIVDAGCWDLRVEFANRRVDHRRVRLLSGEHLVWWAAPDGPRVPQGGTTR